MSTQAAISERPSYVLVVVGVLLPAFITIVNTRLQAERAILPFMLALVVEVGLLGVLCGSLIRPLWLACVIYGWVWLVMDLPVIALAMQDQWPWVLISDDTLPAALLGGQLGLVIVWVVLGQIRWSTRWPVALFLATGAFVPLVWHRMRPAQFLIMLLLQLGIFFCGCCVLRWRGFRLCRQPTGHLECSGSSYGSVAANSQFQIRDILFWMTTLGLALAVAKAVGFWPTLVEAWQRIILDLAPRGMGAILSPAPRLAIFSSVVLLVALWAALRPGKVSRQLALFLAIVLTIAGAEGLLEMQVTRGISIFNARNWQLFWYFEWVPMSWIALSGGMLYAALLFPRALGYRLARSTKHPTGHSTNQ